MTEEQYIILRDKGGTKTNLERQEKQQIILHGRKNGRSCDMKEGTADNSTQMTGGTTNQ